MFLSASESELSRRGQVRQVFGEGADLRERHVQLRVFVRDPAQILRGRLQFLQSVGRFRRHRLDDVEHLGDRFAEIRDAFAREHLAIVRRGRSSRCPG